MGCRTGIGPRDRRSDTTLVVSMSDHIEDQIALIAKHEQEFLAKRTAPERLGDHVASFVGSLRFVFFHVTVFSLWIGWNVTPGKAHFDPWPFALLDTIVAIEALLLASFILMRQGRISRRADERDHLVLQVLLLTEKELTAVLNINRAIAIELGLKSTANTPEIKELSQHTSIDDVARTIQEQLTSD